ncbi:MAG: hypothetical protein PHW46_01445 [Candidatus Omnitrophica bacterium]|nr:hypothetical protein [Candidatus Omnitrophota bacterium]
MHKLFKNKNGFSATEAVFAAIISALVIASIFSVWIFTYRSWGVENDRTILRVKFMEAVETIKEDMRLSSLTYMTFYPASGEPYIAVSIPIAVIDSNGFFTLDSNGEILWDKTVIYHTFTDDDGNTALRRTVFSTRDNNMTEAERYAQLEGVVTNGIGGSGSTTDLTFLPDIETFEISSISPIIDFYDASSTPVKVGKVVFGWARLNAGNHTVRFEVTGKNSLSAGYDIGVDCFSIEPAGSVREMEYYNSAQASSGMLSVSGGSANRVYDSQWSNRNFIEFDASGVGSYMAVTDYYDLWRESAFDNASLNKTEKIEEEMRIALDVPSTDATGDVIWFAHSEAGDPVEAGRNGDFPVSYLPPITLRTVITHDSIDKEGDFIRVGFRAPSASSFTINRAYITERIGTSGASGLTNRSSSGLEPEEFHRHQQLFFEDDSGSKTSAVTINAGEEVWCVWTEFPIRTDKDYLITIYVSDAGISNCLYWEGSDSTARTYYLLGVDDTKAGTPDWSAETPLSSEDIFVVSRISVGYCSGSVESQVFDTTLNNPVYGGINWSEYEPQGATVSAKARSNSTSDMVGATAWESVAQGTIDGNGRYIQFLGELSLEPVWESGGGTISYENYIGQQLSLPVYSFPESGGVPYVTSFHAPWIDDVEIKWQGGDKICTVTGYIAKKNDYGQAKVVIDGTDLIKLLSVHIKASKTTKGTVLEEENFVEVEPRNTGK